MGTYFRIPGLIKPFAGVCLALAFIWSSSLIPIHAQKHATKPGLVDEILWQLC